MILFELSDRTMRQRRNMLVVSSLIIAIGYFDIDISKVSTSGMELDGLTTEVVVVSLGFIMGYLAAAYTVAYREELGIWHTNNLLKKSKDKVYDNNDSKDTRVDLQSFHHYVEGLWDDNYDRAYVRESVFDFIIPTVLVLTACYFAYPFFLSQFFSS